MVIAFWNIDKNEKKKANQDFSDVLIDLVMEYGVDILLLAEANNKTILNFIKKSQRIFPQRPFRQILGSKGRTAVLTTYSSTVFFDRSNLYPSTRWDAFLIEIPGIIRFNLFSVHFHSKLNWSDSSLALECTNLIRDIQIVESKTICDETVLIGDFNMNPFEDGLVAANGIHAIQDLAYAHHTTKGREIDGSNYKYFYNPMWNFFGDFKKPMGTHYHRTSHTVSQEWNIYDQVIFRPSMKVHLDKDYVEIIQRIKTYDLVGYFGRPDDGKYSDHLPLDFKLKI